LPSWIAAAAEDWLGKTAMNLMLIGVATRKIGRAVRLPEGPLPRVDGDGTSKSPLRPRRVSERRNSVQNGSASDGPTSITRRKAVLIGAHAKSIVGWPDNKSRALLDDLLARVTRPEHTYRHEWRNGDVVVWDDRAVVHRATPYDGAKHRRLMQRTTISMGDSPA
jgi:hypothetical protein